MSEEKKNKSAQRPKAKAKAKSARKLAKAKAAPKKRGKAAAKAKATAKAKAKLAKKKQADAKKKPSRRTSPEYKQLLSRKSSSYHAAKKKALAEGLDVQAANAAARAASRLHTCIHAICCQQISIIYMHAIKVQSCMHGTSVHKTQAYKACVWTCTELRMCSI